MNLVHAFDAFSDTIMPAIALFVGLHQKAFNVKPYGRLLLFLLITFIVFGISNYMADRKMNNIFIYNIFGCIECFFLLSMFIGEIRRQKIKKMIVLCYCLLVGFYLYSWLVMQRLSGSFSVIILMSSTIAVAICFLFLFDIIQNRNTATFKTYPMLWIFSAFFIFSLGAIGIETCYILFSGRNMKMTTKFWIIYDVLLIVKYLLICVGISKIKTCNEHLNYALDR